jgi:hypothetical protein
VVLGGVIINRATACVGWDKGETASDDEPQNSKENVQPATIGGSFVTNYLRRKPIASGNVTVP